MTVTELKHRLDVNTLGELPAKTLSLNEVGFCNLATTTPIAFDPYKDNHTTGAFILIDRATNATAAAGLIAFGLRRATNIHRQGFSVGKLDRARIKHQKPAVLWFTGLSGSGKSTIANLVEARLYAHGVHTILLDGDNVRHGLNKDLGFTEVDRVENIRRVGEVAKLMTEAGLIVLCSFISPFRAERRLRARTARRTANSSRFSSIRRSRIASRAIPRASTRRAIAGEIENFHRHRSELRAAGSARADCRAGTQTAEQAAARNRRNLLTDARPHRPHRRYRRRLVDLRVSHGRRNARPARLRPAGKVSGVPLVIPFTCQDWPDAVGCTHVPMVKIGGGFGSWQVFHIWDDFGGPRSHGGNLISHCSHVSRGPGLVSTGASNL